MPHLFQYITETFPVKNNDRQFTQKEIEPDVPSEKFLSHQSVSRSTKRENDT